MRIQRRERRHLPGGIREVFTEEGAGFAAC